MAKDIRNDPFLRDVPELDGYKVLSPTVLYARVGKGGMGAVYRGKHVKFNIDVGVKCLLPHLADGAEQLVLRFEREAQLAARLNHPNLVRVFDVDHRHGIHYLVMEYIKGETARERVARKGPLPLGEAVTIVLQASRGLAAAHANGIIHRDIKPDNIMISMKGEVKLADLGLGNARDAGEGGTGGLTISDVTMGTPKYMPPEQWEGLNRVGQPGDIWALGATLYFLLVGKDAYEGESLTQVMKRVCTSTFPDISERVKDLPTEITQIIRRCTFRDPSERYKNAQELADALEEVVRRHELSGSLGDPDTGTGTARCELVSPPPPELLAKVRVQLESDESRVPTGVGEETAPLPESELSGAASRSRQRSGWSRMALWGVVIVLVLGLSAGAWFFVLKDLLSASGENGPTEPGGAAPVASAGAGGAVEAPTSSGSPSAPAGEADQLYRAVLERLRDRESLEEAAVDLERVLALSPRHREATERLAFVRERLARKYREDGQLARAYEQARRAAALNETVLVRELVAQLRRDVERDLERGLRIAAPAGGAIIPATTLTVSGSLAFEGPISSLTVGKVAAEVADGKFTVVLEGLEDGPLTIPVEVVAIEEGGPRYRYELPVRVDSSVPVLQIDAPASGWARPSAELLGSVEDASRVDVTVNGAPAEVDDDGQWAVTLELAEGQHEITVVARDEGGLETSASTTLRVDSRAPALQRRSPPAAPGVYVTRERTAEVAVAARDEGSLDAVTIGGEEVAVGKDELYRRPVEIPGEGEVLVVEVLARDAAGNTARIEIPILRDSTAPELDFPAPQGELAAGRTRLAGSVRDRTPCRVTVNGEEARVAEDGSWEIELDLAEGEQTITVDAVDGAGNEALALVREVVVAPARPPARPIEGFTVLGRNAQGHDEYLHDQTGIVMILIPGATFTMGTPDGVEIGDADERPAHEVRLGPYLLAKYELSQQAWGKIMARNPSRFEGADLPVESVSWIGALKYCENADPPLRLPTEAQWENACRAGTTGLFSHGDELTTDHANYRGGQGEGRDARGVFRQRTVQVDSFAPNPFGLFNMHGNVWEWCQDVYDPGFYGRPGATAADPVCTEGTELRVHRGGGWRSSSPGCRSAVRGASEPEFANVALGFRPAYYPLP